MSDATQVEYNFFQFDPSQLGADWKQANHQINSPGTKMSNFGILNYGFRRDDDYTRISKGF